MNPNDMTGVFDFKSINTCYPEAPQLSKFRARDGAIAYGGYKLVETFNERGYPCLGDYYSGDLTPGLDNWSYRTMKSGSVDPTLPKNPDDLLKRPGWKETTHPEAGKRGHRTFENEKTGEKLRHDGKRERNPIFF